MIFYMKYVFSYYHAVMCRKKFNKKRRTKLKALPLYSTSRVSTGSTNHVEALTYFRRRDGGDDCCMVLSMVTVCHLPQELLLQRVAVGACEGLPGAWPLAVTCRDRTRLRAAEFPVRMTPHGLKL